MSRKRTKPIVGLPANEPTQSRLSPGQLRAFYHDHFVTAQVRDFVDLVSTVKLTTKVIVDIGGGCGFFAKALEESTSFRVRVIDSDPNSVEVCATKGLDANVGNALAPVVQGDESVVCFNLILHHLVAGSSEETFQMQVSALRSWLNRCDALFVNEYVYDSFLNDLSGKLIYAITSSKRLSFLATKISRLVPSLRANTFGVGVRFRSSAEWSEVFAAAGFELAASRRGVEEHVSIPRRTLLIRSCRRDSYLLVSNRSRRF